MRLLTVIVMLLCVLASSGESSQSITVTRSGSQPSRQGAAENFTGSVRIDPLFNANPPSRTSGGRVTFEPGARTAWHTHPSVRR
jgi:quercetin dioxygenase-like cupin family protein